MTSLWLYFKFYIVVLNPFCVWLTNFGGARILMLFLVNPIALFLFYSFRVDFTFSDLFLRIIWILIYFVLFDHWEANLRIELCYVLPFFVYSTLLLLVIISRGLILLFQSSPVFLCQFCVLIDLIYLIWNHVCVDFVVSEVRGDFYWIYVLSLVDFLAFSVSNPLYICYI